MSPTPILDRQEPAPAPPRRRSRSLLIGCTIGVALGLLELSSPVDIGSGPWALGLVVFLFLGVLAHELGHLAAGVAVGFEFRRIIVGPWMLTRESTGYRLRFVPARVLVFAGYTLMTPRSPDDLRRRFTIFAAGGPLITLLTFLPVLFMPWGWLPVSLLGANLILATFSWIPLDVRGQPTDAKIIQILSRQDAGAERLAAILYLMTLDGRGISPKEWPPHIVANLSAEDGSSAYHAGGRIFLHIYARETAPPAEVAMALERVLALGAEMRADLRRMYFAEAAYWHAVEHRNPAFARAWLENARSVKGANTLKDWDASTLAAIALAEGNPAQFREYLDRALAYLDRQPGPSGSVAASRARLLRLSESAVGAA